MEASKEQVSGSVARKDLRPNGGREEVEVAGEKDMGDELVIEEALHKRPKLNGLMKGNGKGIRMWIWRNVRGKK